MNNFNNVFLAIKRQCGTSASIAGPECLEKVAKEAGVPAEKIEFFLNTLQDLQLIRYSIKEQYIRLTPFGRKQERLFTD